MRTETVYRSVVTPQFDVIPGGFIHPQHRAGWQHGFVFQRVPARGFWHSEGVLFGVVIFDFQFISNRLRVFIIRVITRHGVDVVRVANIAEQGDQLLLTGLKGTGDILQEDKSTTCL